MAMYDPKYSEPWMGQDSRMWREVKYWVGNGWRSFIQYQDDLGNWWGY